VENQPDPQGCAVAILASAFVWVILIAFVAWIACVIIP
jgi:hypothetical protein